MRAPPPRAMRLLSALTLLCANGKACQDAVAQQEDVIKYLVDWLQSSEGAAKEGVASKALPSGFIGLVAADMIQPWATFVKGQY